MKLFLLFCLSCFWLYSHEFNLDHLSEGPIRESIENEIKRREELQNILQSQPYSLKSHEVISKVIDLQLNPEEGMRHEKYQHVILFPERGLVFKGRSRRERERVAWELSCLFGLDTIFLPEIGGIWEGEEGCFQIYLKNAIPKDQLYSRRFYPYVFYEGYLRAALTVLLFAIKDLHHENVGYRLTAEGALLPRFFDVEGAFEHETFSLIEKDGFKSVITPFSWIGWDFNHAHQKLPPKIKREMIDTVDSWKPHLDRIQAYAPYSFGLLNDMQIAALNRRYLLMKGSLYKGTTPKSWLYSLFPAYSDAEKMVKKNFSKESTSDLLFRLYWHPEYVYSIAKDGGSGLRTWLDSQM